MPEGTPDPPVEQGKSPVAAEAQEAAGEQKPVAEEPQGRTYSESYVKQLRNEAASSRNKIGELEEKLQEIADRDKSQQEKLNDQLTAEKARADAHERKSLRYEVAAEHGLDMATAEFLSGTTREEMELQAEKLQQLLADKGKPTTAGFDGGARTTAPQRGTPEEEHNKLLLQALGRESRAS